MRLKITIAGFTIVDIGTASVDSNALLDCAKYHEDYARGVLTPVCGREEPEGVKAWSRSIADKHLGWAKNCRTAAEEVGE